MPKRSHKDGFLNVGFTSISERGEVKPQCVLVFLSVESLKLNKLQRHLEKKHLSLVGRQRGYFERREQELKRSRFEAPDNPALQAAKQATLASYHVSLRIAKHKVAHTIGEELVKPAAIEMTQLVCGDDAARKLQSVQMSNNTVRGRIKEMSLEVKDQIVGRMKKSPIFSLQLDESTDIAKSSQLMVFARYVGDKDVEEEFLFCEPLTTTTTGADVFNMCDKFFIDEGLDWNNCVALCVDGAPSMLGARNGFVARVKRVNANVHAIHCLLHRENLAAKRLSDDLGGVMQDVIVIVNYIKSSALNSRLFEQMCIDFGSEYKHLLFYSNVRWLSRGKVLKRVVDMRMEVEVFLTEKSHRLADKFSDKLWMLKVCYLSDIFTLVNELNISMQGRDETIITLSERLVAFKAKLKLWKGKMEKDRLAPFPSLNGYVDEWIDDVNFEDVKSSLVSHLEQLIDDFDRYIPDDQLLMGQAWIRNPFLVNVRELEEEDGVAEDLIDIQHDGNLRILFGTSRLSEFWTTVAKEKPLAGEKPLALLVPFSTTYLCEQGFSALTMIKTKLRNRLDPQDDLRLTLTKVMLDIEKLVSNKKQLHISH
ncbi:hypothetical protein BSKO_02861 [Bryopsis sp. KO-2023]|nr:hypothetical protein BSKO_02861 [Bryopsis sp. KO-2023]